MPCKLYASQYKIFRLCSEVVMSLENRTHELTSPPSVAVFGEVPKWGSQHWFLPSLYLTATNKSLHSVTGNDQLSGTSQWQLSPTVDSYWNLLVATTSCFPYFPKSLFMFMLPFVRVSLWYSNSNAECVLEYLSLAEMDSLQPVHSARKTH